MHQEQGTIYPFKVCKFAEFNPLLAHLTIAHYSYFMKATLTSKGQITIPLAIRNKFHLKPGDVLEFDESAPILKATKVISTEAWEQFGKQWKDPWPDHRSESVLDELRGPVELPPVTP